MGEPSQHDLGGRSATGQGAGTALFDPAPGDEPIRVDATGLDLHAGFAFARDQGGSALRALNFCPRRATLQASTAVLDPLA
jgi:3,4-dehydroadipyl-CoA semialdehyde dehydrogenase